MPDLHSVLTARPAFADLPVTCTGRRGVIVCDRYGLGLATVLVRKGGNEALEQRVREHFNIELPPSPHRAIAGDIAFAGTAPRAWLATRERGGNAFTISLNKTIGDLASVSDQSDAYAVLRLSGPKVRDALYKLLPVDVHPRVFKIGCVSVTVAAHIGVTMWRLDDDDDGSPVFEIAVFRSLAASFWHALSESAGEFGVVIAQP
jgi:heterotetrameric sarcosine oxidase gamma subunit